MCTLTLTHNGLPTLLKIDEADNHFTHSASCRRRRRQRHNHIIVETYGNIRAVDKMKSALVLERCTQTRWAWAMSRHRPTSTFISWTMTRVTSLCVQINQFQLKIEMSHSLIQNLNSLDLWRSIRTRLIRSLLCLTSHAATIHRERNFPDVNSANGKIWSHKKMSAYVWAWSRWNFISSRDYDYLRELVVYTTAWHCLFVCLLLKSFKFNIYTNHNESMKWTRV